MLTARRTIELPSVQAIAGVPQPSYDFLAKLGETLDVDIPQGMGPAILRVSETVPGLQVAGFLDLRFGTIENGETQPEAWSRASGNLAFLDGEGMWRVSFASSVSSEVRVQVFPQASVARYQAMTSQKGATVGTAKTITVDALGAGGVTTVLPEDDELFSTYELWIQNLHTEPLFVDLGQDATASSATIAAGAREKFTPDIMLGRSASVIFRVAPGPVWYAYSKR